ncbi:tRNA (adenosine(37)-N6)-threonylcarbamoyltransferase complex ATPase subunit type 1 TsaE [Pelagibacterium sp.]|uniref:tRNA (adenosine(37)-N6)-threonylcarbamoyltransferase complex ATPase subunit type 1 TsaE n=1 Tax=Pelagibacterium sp. TaxID=1967288 RepID=UPI003BADB744
MIALLAPDDAATDAIGAAIAAHLRTGDIVTLEGDLGVGKTALARAIIRARLGAPDLEVPSPTFAIVQPYDGIIHADLYRLADESEIDELGLIEDESDIVLVEWPERAPTLLRRPGLGIEIGMGPQGIGRVVRVMSRGHQRDGLADALAPWRAEETQ